MIKNILLHFFLCFALSSITALLQHLFGGFCDSMCGLYYAFSFVILLPALFVVGLSIPIGKKIYPKDNILLLKKRRISIIFGVVTMSIILVAYITLLK